MSSGSGSAASGSDRWSRQLGPTVPADQPVRDLEDLVVRRAGDVLPVERDGEVLAALHVRALSGQPTGTVGDHAVPIGELPEVPTDADLAEARDRFDDRDLLRAAGPGGAVAGQLATARSS